MSNFLLSFLNTGDPESPQGSQNRHKITATLGLVVHAAGNFLFAACYSFLTPARLVTFPKHISLKNHIHLADGQKILLQQF